MESSHIISLSDLRGKVEGKSGFTVFHSFEPNGHLTVGHALRYAIVSKIVKECGGKYILFIDDVRCSQDMFFIDVEPPKPQEPKESKEAGNQDGKGKKEKKAKKVKLTAQEIKQLRRDCIKKSIDYSMKAFEALGVLGPHVQIIQSSEFSLNNYDLFYQMVSNSTCLSINDVKSKIPPPPKNKVLSASQLIAPCLYATEIQFLKPDFVICPENFVGQLDILKTLLEPEKLPTIVSLPQITNLKNTTPVKPDPKNNYFFEDIKTVVGQKSNGAFCTDDVKGNPVFQYIAFLLLPFHGTLDLNGKQYTTVQQIIDDFAGMDKKTLKHCLAYLIDETIDPVRCAFQIPENHPLRDGVGFMGPTTQ